MKRWLVLCTLVLAAPVAAGTVIPLTIGTVRGLPIETADRAAFLAAFHSAMDTELPAESLAGGVWTPAAARRNPFQLVDVAAPDEAWSVDLSIGFPPEIRVERARPKGSKTAPPPRISGVRASRGLTVAVTVTPPPGVGTTADGAPQKISLYFSDARRVLVPSAKVPGGGYDYPWSDAGIVVARVVLEALDRARGAMDGNTRADLTPATRAATEEEAP